MQNDQLITQSQVCINTGQWICDWLIYHNHNAFTVYAAGRDQADIVDNDIVCCNEVWSLDAAWCEATQWCHKIKWFNR